MLPRRPLDLALDLAMVAATHLVAVIAFGPVFQGTAYLIAGIGGLLLGIGVGFATSLRQLRGWWQSAAGVVVVFVLFGPALAVPHATIAGFLPTLGAWRELLLGVVFSWKGLLTAQPPADGFPSVLVVPFITVLLCSTVATVLALRLRRLSPLAVLPGLLALVVAIAFGTRIAAAPILLGLISVGVSIAWAAWRTAAWRKQLAVEVEVTLDATNRQAARKRRALGALAMVAAALVVGGAVSVPLQGEQRQVLRDAVQPPVDLEDYPSPLAGFRGWIRNFEDQTLMTVAGMPEDSRVRLATLDAYEGTVYAVAGSKESSGSGSFARVGSSIQTQQSGERAEVEVTIGDYRGIWIPDVGYSQSIAFEGDRAADLQSTLHYNSSTGTAITTAGLADGDSYTLDAIVPKQPSMDELEGVAISDVRLPEAVQVPDAIASFAADYGTTERTKLANILHMQRVLRAGAFSHGLEGDSLAGHGAARIQAMLEAKTLLGDDEQYAVVFALALERIGVPARVVMGFYPDDGFTGSEDAVKLSGAELHAWVEIPFEGYGWVAFDPTPPEDQTEIQPEPQPQPDPKPQVLQPPQPPDDPVELQPDTQADEGQQDDDEREAASFWPIVFAVLGSILVLVALALLPFLIVGLLKARRRRRRFEAASQSDRLSGGWHEVVDQAVDLGLDVPGGITRREVAEIVGDRYPRSQATAIGEYVDAGVFGPGEPPAEDVDAFWSDVDSSVAAMRGEATRRERLRSRLSLRSFRGRRNR